MRGETNLFLAVYLIIHILVGGLEHEWIMTFHSVGNVIIPTDSFIFFGVGIPPSRYHHFRKDVWSNDFFRPAHVVRVCRDFRGPGDMVPWWLVVVAIISSILKVCDILYTRIYNHLCGISMISMWTRIYFNLRYLF